MNTRDTKTAAPRTTKTFKPKSTKTTRSLKDSRDARSDKPARATATKSARPLKESNTVYVSNLNYNRDKIGIKNLFDRYGKIKNINLVIDYETKISKGMAFVEMETVEQAKLAIEGLNQEEIDGRTLKASFAIAQKPLVLKLKEDIDAEKKAKSTYRPSKAIFDKFDKTKKAAKPAMKKEKATPTRLTRADLKTTTKKFKTK